MFIIDRYVSGGHGIWYPPSRAAHRDEDYDSAGFASLLRMQKEHFWYKGRHRFVLHAVRQLERRHAGPRAAIDLGGGCGGWVAYLRGHAPSEFQELALADSSEAALSLAATAIPADVRRYSIDLLDLQWQERWDVAFLLDVLEHIERDVDVLRQIREALRPGGHLIVTTPALERFRTPFDEMSHHVRRYARQDFQRLARESGMTLVRSRYFMFLLSPLMWLARRRIPDPVSMTRADIREYLNRADRIPPAPLNAALGAIFAAETPAGAWCPFPWGMSVLAILRRPA